MKLVIDTNILVSALFLKNGASHYILTSLFGSKKKYMVISNTLLTEYADVLTRDENIKAFKKFSKEDIEMFLDDLCSFSYHQKINFLWRPFLKDLKDDMLVEVAFNSRADFIVTNNEKDFVGVEKYSNIKVINSQNFCKFIKKGNI